MDTLDRIQKGMSWLEILSRIFMILYFIAATGSLILTLLFTFSVFDVASSFFSSLDISIELTNENMTGALLLTAISFYLNGILYFFGLRYFKEERREGTPFTEKGADRIKKLGILCIAFSIGFTFISDIITALMDLEEYSSFDDVGSVFVGVLLILLHMIFKYGTELEAKAQSKN